VLRSRYRKLLGGNTIEGRAGGSWEQAAEEGPQAKKEECKCLGRKIDYIRNWGGSHLTKGETNSSNSLLFLGRGHGKTVPGG